MNKMNNHFFIKIDEHAMSRIEAEERVMEALAAYGVQKSKSHIRKNGLALTDRNRTTIKVTFNELVDGTTRNGEIPHIDRMRWRDTDPYGTVAIGRPNDTLPPMSVGSGPRTSPPLAGVGYLSNDVTSDLLDDALFYRTETARLSQDIDMFRPCFRAFRAYLATTISIIDAFLNRRSWYACNTPDLTPMDAVKVLSQRRLGLDDKLRKWLPEL